MLRAAQWLYGLAVVTNAATTLMMMYVAPPGVPPGLSVLYLIAPLVLLTVVYARAVHRIGQRIVEEKRHEQYAGGK